jgi:hypothetical protein
VQTADEWAGVGRFGSFQEFRELLRKREHLVCENVAHQLATFALGRAPGFAEREPLKAIATKARTSGTGMRTLVLDLISSPVFANP